MSDVRLFDTVDGGEIEITSIPGGGDALPSNARFTLDHSPSTAAYLSLFGGNDEDDGSTATERKQWWGNLTETDRSRQYRSETQALLRTIPATTSNMRRIEDAAARDLAWMVAELGAKVTVSASMPGLNQIRLEGSIELDGATTEFNFLVPWSAEA